MKQLIVLGLLGAIVTPQVAQARPYVGTIEQECYRQEYREVYHPGTRTHRGYIDYETVNVRVPCHQNGAGNPYVWDESVPDYQPRGHVDDNDCSGGTIVGAVLGGAIAAGVSQPDSMPWSIPLGAVGGALVGCQAAGG